MNRRAMLAALAAALLGLAVVGIVSPTILGLGRAIGIRLGLVENAILLASGALVAWLASRQP